MPQKYIAVIDGETKRSFWFEHAMKFGNALLRIGCVMDDTLTVHVIKAGVSKGQ